MLSSLNYSAPDILEYFWSNIIMVAYYIQIKIKNIYNNWESCCKWKQAIRNKIINVWKKLKYYGKNSYK